MSERIHVLVQQVLGKNSLEECDLDEIKNLANRYPYFAPAQFLLLQKLKQENSPDYSAQLQKSVLYYHDPLQFEYFISSGRFYTERDLEESPQPAVNHESFHRPDTTTDQQEQQNFETTVSSKIEIIDVIQGAAESEEPITASMEKVLEKEKKQSEETAEKDDLLFEPYHTVDYFASQGIKLSQEEVPKDKFGKQLKSFTDWLKTMKRLPVAELPKNIDASSETKVQHLAEDSVHDADVVTEAMAEVWIKQGNLQKAIETYNKLSLLNPSKKAYFAGLIENLKRS